MVYVQDVDMTAVCNLNTATNSSSPQFCAHACASLCVHRRSDDELAVLIICLFLVASSTAAAQEVLTGANYTGRIIAVAPGFLVMSA